MGDKVGTLSNVGSLQFGLSLFYILYVSRKPLNRDIGDLICDRKKISRIYIFFMLDEQDYHSISCNLHVTSQREMYIEQTYMIRN